MTDQESGKAAITVVIDECQELFKRGASAHTAEATQRINQMIMEARR